MEYKQLGRSGLKISSLVLGTLNFGNPTSKEEAFRIIDRAFETGKRFRSLLKKCFYGGCSKMPRYKAPEILRSEAYSNLRRNDAG